MKDLRKNKPEYKPRLQPSVPPVSRDPEATGVVERTNKEKEEKKLKDNALGEVLKKVGEDPRTPPGLTKVDVMNPAFDPDIPEQKQRWLR